MEKRLKDGIIMAAAITTGALIAGLVIWNVLVQLEEDSEELALVSFHLDDSGFLNITCEIADTQEEQRTGLMHRTELPEDEGMLFVYETPRRLSFWMKNTLIPLDMVFIDEDGLVLNVEEAHVETGVSDDELTRYHSNGSAMYVLEMNLGLSAQHGIGPGTEVDIAYMD
ncbi:MAG: DUF192 domain-containing protein [Thermoplasmata archaeon]|nr:MAG: DUF192 domain-containing protein [Thermoplasmata archaeon]